MMLFTRSSSAAALRPGAKEHQCARSYAAERAGRANSGVRPRCAALVAVDLLQRAAHGVLPRKRIPEAPDRPLQARRRRQGAVLAAARPRVSMRARRAGSSASTARAAVTRAERRGRGAPIRARLAARARWACPAAASRSRTGWHSGTRRPCKCAAVDVHGHGPQPHATVSRSAYRARSSKRLARLLPCAGWTNRQHCQAGEDLQRSGQAAAREAARSPPKLLPATKKGVRMTRSAKNVSCSVQVSIDSLSSSPARRRHTTLGKDTCLQYHSSEVLAQGRPGSSGGPQCAGMHRTLRLVDRCGPTQALPEQVKRKHPVVARQQLLQVREFALRPLRPDQQEDLALNRRTPAAA